MTQDSYRERIPAGPLRSYVECIWTRSAGAAGGGAGTVPHSVLPDGCIDIVFASGASPQLAAGRVVGTMRRPVQVAGVQNASFVGVRFRPGAARLFLDFRAAELTDGDAALAEFWGGEAARLTAEVNARGPERSAGVVEAALLARLPQREPDARVRRAIAEVEASRGAIRVQDLAREAGISRQHLAAGFRDWVGTSAKFFARVVRFRSLLASLRKTPHIPWVERALEFGYFDQAHLSADFAELAGTTPSAYLRTVMAARAKP